MALNLEGFGNLDEMNQANEKQSKTNLVTSNSILQIKLSDIEEDSEQPRKMDNEASESLKELAEMKKAEEKTENNIAKIASEVKNFVDEGKNEL